MAAINPNALGKFIGYLYVAPQATPGSLVRVASVRNLVANYDNTANQVDIKADDTGTVFKGFLPEGRIEGSFLEIMSRDLINLLLGGTPNDVAGSIVNNFSQVVASGSWLYNNFIELTHQNGDGTLPNIDSVTGATDGALTLNDDYIVVKNAQGKWGIVIIDSTTVTTQAQNVTIQYDYTPNAAEEITLPIVFTESPRLYVKIVATDDDGNERTIVLDDATFEGVYGIEFLDVVEAGDLQGTTFTFKANKGSNVVIHNEIL